MRSAAGPGLQVPTGRRGMVAVAAVLCALALSTVMLGVAEGSATGSADPAATSPCPYPAPPTGPTPHPTHRPTPDPAYPKGVNLSVYDGLPSFARLADAGITFVYTRATSGRSYTDPTHRRAIERALHRGMVVGSYHFFDYRVSGSAQARAFVARVRADGGFEGRLPPVLDIECFDAWGAGDRATTVQGIRDFIEETYRLTGITPMLYLGRWTWREWLGDPALFGDTRLWIACWTCGPEPRTATGWDGWVVWQLGRWFIEGVTRPVGANVFQGTRPELRALARRAPRLTIEAAEEGGTVATVDLSRVDGVAWQVRIDDDAWSGWAPWAASVTVGLGEATGPRIVRVRLRDAHGTRSPVRRFDVQVTPPAAVSRR